MRGVNAYLMFNGQAEEAFRFYHKVFGGEIMGLHRYKDFADMDVSVEEQDKIAHTGLMLSRGNALMGSDILESQGQTLMVGDNVYIMLDTDTGEEAERVFSALAGGGRVEMPLQKTEWAERYGICQDQYGILWMVNYGGDVELP